MSALPEPANRLERRKQRTRAALINAAQTLIAEGRLNVPVLEITQAADVGMGSFYNHFDSKEQLFDAPSPRSSTPTGRCWTGSPRPSTTPPRRSRPASGLPAGSSVVGRRRAGSCWPTDSTCCSSDRGLAPRALRDINAAVRAGRFRVEDPELALAMAGGALLGLGNLLRANPDRDDARAADAVTEYVLQLFGLTAEEAHQVCLRPLPDLDAVNAN